MSYWIEKAKSCDPDVAKSADAAILRKALSRYGNLEMVGKELEAFIIVQCCFAQEDRQSALDSGDDDQAADEVARNTLLSSLPEEPESEDNEAEAERRTLEDEANEAFLELLNRQNKHKEPENE